MSLRDPTKKMSKSDKDKRSCILLTDDPKTISSKLSKATTDSIREIYYDPVNRPGVSSLLEIYSAFDANCNDPSHAAQTVFKGLNNQALKTATAELLISHLAPIQDNYSRIIKDKGYVLSALENGEEFARESSAKTLNS
ncbi:Tryptophan-tRNA ligase, partial [Smittium culicis]